MRKYESLLKFSYQKIDELEAANDQLRQRIEHQQHEIETLRQWANSVTTQASTDKMWLEVERDRLKAAQAPAMANLPQRPVPAAPANTAGLSWDAYSGVQMLAYGRECADMAAPQPATVPEPKQGPYPSKLPLFQTEAEEQLVQRCELLLATLRNVRGMTLAEYPETSGDIVAVIDEAIAKVGGAHFHIDHLDNNTVRYTFKRGVIDVSYVRGVASVEVRG